MGNLGHTVENIILAVKSYLTVANALHGHTAESVLLSQKHTLVVNDTIHILLSDSLGGLINIQPDGHGGGFGGIDGFGVKGFGGINIELPLNYLIIAEDSYHNLTSDELAEFIQIFNMVRTGVYEKDFGDSGATGQEYAKDAGTMPVNNGSFGQITPVSDTNNGFFVVEIGTRGSYGEDTKDTGIFPGSNSSQGSFSTDEIDTGNYNKIK